MGEFLYNIGEIVLRNDECFWIFSENYYANYDICSPWFSYRKEKWCLVKQKHSWIFRLWRINNSNLPKQEYTVQLSLDRAGCDACHFAKCTADIDSDYGCQLDLPGGCSCGRYYKDAVTQNGLLKLIFDIQRKTRFETSIASNLNKEAIPGANEEISGGGDAGNNEDEGIDKKENFLETKGVDRLIKNIENLLLNEWGSDVVLKNSDHEFRAHMTILGARSPVFAAMFQHDMKEKKTGEVDISDCSTAEFKVFLQFLYSGNADISSVNVLQLYYIADKYQVDDLKLDCVENMKDTLTVDNFCDVISLSLRHSESDLQKSATQFFCCNIKAIVKTVQWQKYLAENPTHANELIIKAVNAWNII